MGALDFEIKLEQELLQLYLENKENLESINAEEEEKLNPFEKMASPEYQYEQKLKIRQQIIENARKLATTLNTSRQAIQIEQLELEETYFQINELAQNLNLEGTPVEENDTGKRLLNQ